MNTPNSLRGLSSDAHWDYENGFYWFSPRSRMNKLLAHYEIYKKIVDLPGHVFEFGVYKGASLIRFATFRDALENDFARKIVGFDAFGAFPKDDVKDADDQKFIARFEESGGDGLEDRELQGLLAAKNFQNVDLVKGNIFDTLPTYLDQNPAARIARLHLDLDTKEPTDRALELLYDRVVSGGIIVFDDYNAVAGATQSADAFVAKFGLRMQKLPFYTVPSFVEKP